MSDVTKITIETQRPKGSFPGRIEIGHYVIADGAVILTDEKGRPIGGDGTKRHLGNGDVRLIACAMLRQRTRSVAKSRSFNRPISYPREWRGVWFRDGCYSPFSWCGRRDSSPGTAAAGTDVLPCRGLMLFLLG
jgi:hypothetical protein